MDLTPELVERIKAIVGAIIVKNLKRFAWDHSLGTSLEDLKHDILAGGSNPGMGIAEGRGKLSKGVLQAMETFHPKFDPLKPGTKEEQAAKQLNAFVGTIAWRTMADRYRDLSYRAQKGKAHREEEAREMGDFVTNLPEESYSIVNFHPPLIDLATHCMALTTHVMPLLTHRNAPGPFTVPQMTSSLILAWERNWTPRALAAEVSKDKGVREVLRFRWRVPSYRAFYRFERRGNMPKLVKTLHARALREMAEGISEGRARTPV